MRLRTWLALTAALAVGGLSAGLVMASSGSPGHVGASAAKGFHPKQIAGKWKGKWKNKTFNSRGSIRAKVSSKGKTMRALVDLGGFVFGCADPDAEVAILRKGRGKNRWNGKGFRIASKSKALGAANFTYKHATNVFKGGGKSPDCAPHITYRVKGKLTKDSLRAKVNIKSNGSPFAKSKLGAKKR